MEYVKGIVSYNIMCDVTVVTQRVPGTLHCRGRYLCIRSWCVHVYSSQYENVLSIVPIGIHHSHVKVSNARADASRDERYQVVCFTPWYHRSRPRHSSRRKLRDRDTSMLTPV